MKYTFGSVNADILSPVHSRVHFCRDAALLRLSGGKNKIECRYKQESHRDYFDLYIDNKLMLDGSVGCISTSSAVLRTGYGESMMTDQDCAQVSQAINAPYADLNDAVRRITPLLGLLDSGMYLISDFELFPVSARGIHALDAKYCYNEEGKLYSGYNTLYDAPMYLLPTQRASLLNSDRICSYMDMFRQQTAGHIPRCIALYLNGSVALLLDGHHKAAAAAALGQRVKTLIIFPVQETESLSRAIKNREKLEICHTRWDYEKDCFAESQYAKPISLCDQELHTLAHVHCLHTLKKSAKEALPFKNREEFAPWGKVPDEFCQNLHNYPDSQTLREGTRIPPDKIKLCMRRVMQTPWQSRMCEYARELIAFNELFPDSSMLTDQQRARLQKEKMKV